MTPYYNAQFFIDKFDNIPEENWLMGKYSDGAGKKCALGHCGVIHGWLDDSQAAALVFVLATQGANPVDVNDGHDVRYTQATPKQRILAALRDAQKGGR